MQIDVHAHCWTDAYFDMLVELGRADTATQRGIGAGGGAELDARLRLMDRAGVDFPHEEGDTFVRAVDYVMDVAYPGEAHAILDANAMALFKLA